MLKTLAWRFALPTLLAIIAGAYFAMPYAERLLTEWFRSDIDMRAQLVMGSMEEPLAALVEKPSPAKFKRFFSRLMADKRLLAVLVCRPDGQAIYQTEPVPPHVSCAQATVDETLQGRAMGTPEGSIYVSRFDATSPEGTAFRTLIVHDLSFVDRRQSTVRDYLVAFSALSAVALILLTAGIAWFLLRGWAGALIRDIRGKRFLDETESESPHSSFPILSQVRKVLREIEENQRMEMDFRENWTPNALRHVVQEHLDAPQMVVVSNREPYIHTRDADGRPRVQMPASGMVTALEPVIRACSGVWVAHGSGAADRDVVDLHDRVRVPPADPQYTLRRVWLTEEEENGYYYGFSNEGLWPLCHVAYVRPAFREEDWKHYVAVNRKFAGVIRKEAPSDSPVIFVQDYHFALLPGLVRDKIPGATIVLFWHIPWPNEETFGVCPWKEELLHGILMADIVGFHTLYHCQNFLATVARYVECQIDHEHMSVTVQNHVCHIAAYPISIEWPPRWLEQLPSVEACRRNARARFGIAEGVAIGVGVERWDFTKGIVERFQAFDKLLERHPECRGKVSLLQVAAPTRSKLPAYQALRLETDETAQRINQKWGTPTWQPVVLIAEHQEPVQVFELYRAADFCLVNSLHDGMNLVAKEFVSARDDEDGVLILSTFAGASRELIESLLVNPYDIGQTADAIHAALRMPREERRERMRLMRLTVKENSVYRWAGRMLMDAARVRQRQRLRQRSSLPATQDHRVA